jgi:RNA polymerase sigma-70 factor (ECF subfamily)
MLPPLLLSPGESHEIFMQLLARHEPVIRGYLRSLVSRAADVDELMPDVALVAWRKFSELREPEAFPRWACVIARYEALRFRRDRARDRLVLDEAVIAKLADEGAGETPLRARQMAALEVCVDRGRDQGCRGPDRPHRRWALSIVAAHPRGCAALR